MEMPLAYVWRVEAAKQWYRDIFHKKTPTSVYMRKDKPAAVKGCGGKTLRCAVCEMPYDYKNTKFNDVMRHMLFTHPEEAKQIYLT